MTLDYFYGQSGELFSYFRIPKALFQDSRFRQLSTDARTLYGILLDRMSLSVKNGWMDKQGRVYIIYTVREVQESLCCAEHKAVKLFRELEQIDLIERKRRGLGRPSLIYVKDFTTGLSKTHNLNCANRNSDVAQSAVQEQPKTQANKTDKNNTEMNKPDPIHSGDIREQLGDYFHQTLEVELLLRLFPDDEDTIYQIVDLLVDTDPQGSLAISMGWQQPDELPTTLSTLMQKAMNDQSIQPGEGILAITEQSGYPWSRMAFNGIWKAITHNRKEVNMAFARTEVKELEPMVKSGKKRFAPPAHCRRSYIKPCYPFL